MVTEAAESGGDRRQMKLLTGNEDRPVRQGN